MIKISTRKILRHKPLIIDKLTKKAWGSSEKGLLSKALFRNIVAQVKEFYSKEIENLTQDELIALLVDYLRIKGYDATDIGMAGDAPCVTISLFTPDGGRLVGCAIVANLQSAKDARALINKYPSADFYHIFTLGGMPEKPNEKVQIVTPDSILQVLIFVAVFDYFFEEYLHSILAMPGFKDYMYSYLSEHVGLTTQQVDIFDAGWERLKIAGYPQSEGTGPQAFRNKRPLRSRRHRLSQQSKRWLPQVSRRGT
jgi:hypothetical protein